MQNNDSPPPYNVVAIGAGTAGLVTTAAIAALGGKAALVEKNEMGGDCLNFGCVPSKGLISSARLIQRIREASKWGLQEMDPAFDFETVFQSMREARAAIAPNDSQERFQELGVDVFRAEARFRSSRELELSSGEILRARHFVITTGSRAAIPPIEGLQEVGYYTNETIFDQMQEKPRSLLVIGGGPIGSELSQVFCRLGVEVHQVETGEQILKREDEDVIALVMDQFRREGIQLHTKARPQRIYRREGRIHLEVEKTGEVRETIIGDAVLVAAGRIPNLEKLNLKAAGVEFDQRGIRVNARLQTSVPNIWAAGDIAGSYQFTHTADFMARTVVGNILNPLPFLRSKFDTSVIPWSTYTSPEVARVGFNEKDAIRQNIKHDVYHIDLKEVDRAITERETLGFAKVLTVQGRDKILGATLVGEGAGDLLHEIVLAMKAKVGLGTIAKTIHAYPTHAELIRKVADAYNRTRLTPRTAGIFKWLFQRQLKGLR